MTKNERAPKENKRQIVTDLMEKMSKAEGIILAEYKGLTVADLTELRIKLRRIQGELRILHNRLAKIAIKDIAGSEPLAVYFKGPTAAAITYGDPVLLAKTVKEFAGGKEALKIKAGFVSGRFLESPEITRLSKLPSRETLICHLVGLVSSPLRRLVTALSQPQRGLVVALAQIAKKKS